MHYSHPYNDLSLNPHNKTVVWSNHMLAGPDWEARGSWLGRLGPTAVVAVAAVGAVGRTRSRRQGARDDCQTVLYIGNSQYIFPSRVIDRRKTGTRNSREITDYYAIILKREKISNGI